MVFAASVRIWADVRCSSPFDVNELEDEVLVLVAQPTAPVIMNIETASKRSRQVFEITRGTLAEFGT
jgi:hypothetical protein